MTCAVLTNVGNAASSGVVVEDALPAGTTLTSLTAVGWTCTGSAVNCALTGNLAAGGSATITVVLTLAGDYQPSSVSNTATVGPTDGTPLDNTSTATTQVLHAADLAIVKAGPSHVASGSGLTWSLTVTNNGDATAPVVTLTDVLPVGVTFTSLTAVGWTCTGTASISCTLDAPLLAGGSATLSIAATVDATFTGGTVSNTAVVGPVDLTPIDNTSTATTTVTTPLTGGGGGAVGGGETPGSGPVVGVPVVEGPLVGGPVVVGAPEVGSPLAGGAGSPISGAGGGAASGLPFTGAALITWATEAALLLGLGVVFLMTAVDAARCGRRANRLAPSQRRRRRPPGGRRRRQRQGEGQAVGV